MKSSFKVLVCLAILAGLGVFAVSQLELDYRLDAFLPAPADPEQSLVVDQISAGPGGRIVLAALAGGSLEQRIAFSRELAASWRRLDDVVRVDNGELQLDPTTERRLMQARFLLLPDIEQRLGEAALADALADRVADLALGGRQAEELIRRDPLGMVPELATILSPIEGAEQHDGVWLDSDGERALLTVISAWPPFAIAEQTRLVEQLKASFVDLPASETFTLTLGGAPVIAVDSADRSRADAITLSLIGSGFLLLVLSIAWRSPALVLAGTLPLAAGVVAGLLVTALAFDQVHGLTLAFGFTLLGVALDYPIHLFGHARDRRLDVAARAISRPLLLGAASTLIAYLAIWASTSPGLAQLGAFSAAGLATAALVTLALPALGIQPAARGPGMVRAWPYLPWLPLMLAAAALIALVIQGEQRWSSDLTRLSPVDSQALADDLDLRMAMQTGDVRHMMVIRQHSLEATLEATEALVERLPEAEQRGWLAGWQSPTALVPSPARQADRRAAWPDRRELAERLATADARFQPEAFDPFLDDLAQLDQLGELGPDSWSDTALDLRVASLLSRDGDGWRALVLPVGLADADALGSWLSAIEAPAALVDLRATSEAMVTAYRRDAGFSLAIAMALIAVLLLLRLGSLKLAAGVLLPPLAAMLCTAAIMARLDGGLTIVHLIGLLLAGGIGLDFAIFARTLSGDRRLRARTNRAIGLCCLSSGGVFLILGQSDIGLLRMLGLTVALGILLSWIFAKISQPPWRHL